MEKDRTIGTIEGNRVVLKPINLENVLEYSQKIVDLVAEPEVSEALRFFSFFQTPLTINRQLYFFFRMIESKNDQIFAVETKSGEFLGTCGLHDIDWLNDHARAGIIIFNKNYWRKGYGKETLSFLLRFAFKKLGANKIYLTARVDNALAIHIYQRLGFKDEGIMRSEYKIKDGHYLDLLRMSILKKEWLEKLWAAFVD